MTEDEFSRLVDALETGKKTHQAIYIHRSALQCSKLNKLIIIIATAIKQEGFDWNVAKFSRNDFQFSLLHYPDFDIKAYPELHTSLSVNLGRKKHQITRYDQNENPPILHRKELMVLPDYHQYEQFRDITAEGELAGLYDHGTAIGFKLGWSTLIAQAGYELVDGHLFRRSMTNSEQSIDRHKTAINRFSLSAPMKVLERRGYLNCKFSIFDYGCGLGDDLRELHLNGINANGWDPNFRPDEEMVASDIVNLGFVLNVIEDVPERIQALETAYSLANSFLIVSCMLGSESTIANMTPYKDGVITSRNTFQKYFSQSELKTFIQDVLEQDVVTVGPGIVIAFKDKIEEQRFLLGKIRSSPKLVASKRLPKSTNMDYLLEKHQEIVQRYWEQCLNLGREPLKNEIDDHHVITEHFGSLKKLFNTLLKKDSDKLFSAAEKTKRDDYLVYFALQKFERRKPYNSMPEEQQQDIKRFFGNYSNALTEGSDLLFNIAAPEKLAEAAQLAAEQINSAVLCDSSCLILPSEKVSELLPILRVYVGVAGTLYGEHEEADLVKIHIGSGKVTFLTFDDFCSPVPYLKERVKVKLAEQDIDYFDYIDERRRPPLLYKSQYMERDHDHYAKQKGLDTRLEGLGLIRRDSENIVNRSEWNAFLIRNHLEIKGFRLYSTPT